MFNVAEITLGKHASSHLSEDLATLISRIGQMTPNVKAEFPKRLKGAGATNKFGEVQKALDAWTNGFFVDSLIKTGLVRAIYSEELDKPYIYNDSAPFVVTMDPLDGSSNISTNNVFGTIFGIYREDLPQTGRKLVCAIYKLYGPITTLVYTAGNGTGVHEFVKQRAGEQQYLLLHENLKIPAKGEVFGIGGDPLEWSNEFLSFAKGLFKKHKLKVRYCGAFVGDFSQVLHRGGLFSYPSTKKKQQGKLRLYFEAAPMAMIMEEAGGASSNGSKSLLDVDSPDMDSRTPLYMGNKYLIEEFEAAIKNGQTYRE